MVKLKSGLKAATLMESLIAMIIMVVCLAVGTMIYTNVMNSDNQHNQLKALLLLNKEAMDVKKEKNYLDSEKQIGDWTIKRTVEKYDQTQNLYKLSLSATSQGKIIAIRNELVPVE